MHLNKRELLTVAWALRKFAPGDLPSKLGDQLLNRIEQEELIDRLCKVAETAGAVQEVDRDAYAATRVASNRYEDEVNLRIDERTLVKREGSAEWVQAWVRVEDGGEVGFEHLRSLGWTESDVEFGALGCAVHPECEAIASMGEDTILIGIYRKSDNVYVGWIDGTSAQEIHDKYVAGDWNKDSHDGKG